ncbi:zinc finger protein 28-like isoform X3 [Maniola jurtina]|uniref:zinc finger protein 28-like isoform X3 n=1 Tax=Maniola jurtina TaxID=191418 RepID=UPI001E68B7C9|nr:zinc finger protein 28-like isoform X3 [Maniola jurtina]
MAAKTSDWRPGPTVCRCCLSEGCYKDISTEYFWMGKREVYSEMLSETFDLSISYSKSGGPNSQSRLICEPCIARLRDAADFKRQVQECEKTFMSCLDPVAALSDLQAVLEMDKEVKVEMVMKEEKRHSDDDFDDVPDFGDDDDYDDLDDQPLTKLATKIPKKETVDVLDLLDNAKITAKRKSSSKLKTHPSKKSKSKQIATSSKEKPEPKKKKGVIIETDSSIIIKDDDGSEIKLTLLKNPINIEELICEEENEVIQDKNAIIKDVDVIQRKTHKKIISTGTEKHIIKKDRPVAFLNEPLSLDSMELGQKCNIKACNLKMNKVTLRKPKRKTIDLDNQTWKQNALTLFEFSYVYPFIHACNKYKCFVCAKAFLDTSLLREHSVRDHTAKDYKTELNNRVRDKILKVDVTSLQCKVCESISPNLHALKTHLKDHNKKIDPEFKDNMIPFKLGGDDFQCQLCEEKFLKLRLLIMHMSKHFNNYSCETCGAVFVSLHLLRRHLQTHKAGTFPCEVCDKVFSNSAKRTMHVRGVHLKQWPRTCPICPERFNSNYQRTKHLRVVHNQTSGVFKCETCGREYDLKYQLLVHIRSVHMQERTQECGICHSRFFSKYCLSRHMVIHTGQKNFKCEVCGKPYARRANLKEHMKSHENGHVCTVCCQDCGDHASLANHMSHSHGLVL